LEGRSGKARHVTVGQGEFRRDTARRGKITFVNGALHGALFLDKGQWIRYCGLGFDALSFTPSIMHSFPFDESLVSKNRFHGLIQGKFVEQDGKILLLTEFGTIGLWPRPGKRFYWTLSRARKQFHDNPNAVVNVYGYPRANKEGLIHAMVMTNWFSASEDLRPDSKSLCRKFNPGQMFLCGRVKQIEANGIIRVRVKSQIPNVGLRWWDIYGTNVGQVIQHSKILFMGWHESDGKLMFQPIKTVTPPGQKTYYAPVKE
jgi:hypothetical protein